MLNRMLKSIIDQDRAPVVICNLDHIIVYMNNSAITNYAKWGGQELIGKSLLDCHSASSRQAIMDVVEWFLSDTSNNMIYTYNNAKQNKDVYMVALRDDDNVLIGYYEKHEFRDKEKARLYDYSHPIV